MKKLVMGMLLLASCGGGEPCEELCERVDTMGCENQPDLNECFESCAEVDTCEKEYDAYLKCLLKKTAVSDLSCDEESGEVTFPDGVCDDKVGAMFLCALSELDMGE